MVIAVSLPHRIISIFIAGVSRVRGVCVGLAVRALQIRLLRLKPENCNRSSKNLKRSLILLPIIDTRIVAPVHLLPVSKHL